jgi:signal recognition particle subunit SRP54
MVLDKFGSSVKSAINKVKSGSGTLSEDEVKPVIKEIQRSLLTEDVDTNTVSEITDNIENRALNEEPPAGVSPRDHILNIVYEELLNIIGEATEIPLEEQTILLSGLQGSGKTTSSAKIAWWFAKKGLKPAVIQTDTMRPGAHRQLEQLSNEADIMSYTDTDANDAVQIAKDGLEETKEADVRIVDTAGRHATEQQLIDEIIKIEESINPDRNLLVVNAGVGKSVKKQAQKFDNSIGISSVVVTKVDGSAKGGGALTAIRESDASISFLGNGESVKDIERFEPDGFVSRLLGMGDLKQLSERVERAAHETKDDDWEPEDMLEGEFTMYDMKKQMQTVSSMGKIGDIMNMIPGVGSSLLGNLDNEILEMQEQRMKSFEIIIDSMTEEEMKNPSIIGSSRKQRIARGSGTSIEQVEQLIQQYNQMDKLVNQMGSKERMENMAENMDISNLMGGGGPF